MGRSQYYKCQGFRHIASDCGNKKLKKRAFNVTWDDEVKKSKYEKPDTSKEEFMALMATSVAAIVHVYSDDETDNDNNESEEYLDWKIEMRHFSRRP